MSGWQLGLALFGCLLAGWLAGMVTVFLYGRRLIRKKMEAVMRQAVEATAKAPSP